MKGRVKQININGAHNEFNNILSDNLDHSIVADKIDKLYNQLLNNCKLLKVVNNIFNFYKTDTEDVFDIFISYNIDIINSIINKKTYTLNKFGQVQLNKENIENVKFIYNSLMSSIVVTNMTSICKNIKPISKYLVTIEKPNDPSNNKKSKKNLLPRELSDEEKIKECIKIFKSSGKSEFNIFELEEFNIDKNITPIDIISIEEYNLMVKKIKTINFMYIYQNIKSTDTSVFIHLFNSLSKLYLNTYKVWQIMCIPDIDINQIKDYVIQGLDKYNKDPEIKRCKEGCNIIKKSISLLETNIDEYYIEYLKTGDIGSLIMEFMKDIGEISKNDSNNKDQIKSLMLFFKKKASQNIDKIKDPKIKNMINTMNTKLDIMSNFDPELGNHSELFSKLNEVETENNNLENNDILENNNNLDKVDQYNFEEVEKILSVDS